MNKHPAQFRYRGEVAVQYDKIRMNSGKWKREQETIHDMVAAFEVGTTILDVPFGSGRFLEYYESEGHTVFGLDISKDMLLRAKEKCTDGGSMTQMIIGEAEHLPMSDHSVDCVICVRLLNWVSMPALKDILKECRRVAPRTA